MKIRKKYPVVFISAFLVGSVAFLLTMQFSQSKYDTLSIPKEVVTNEVSNQPVEEMWKLETVDKIDNYNFDNEKPKPFKIKLLETGELEGDNFDGKTGETWLGLFKENDDYFLRPAKLKVRPLYEDINRKQVRVGKIVSVSDKKEPIFLIKNANFLKQGKVNTLFKGMNYKEVYKFGNPNITPMYQVTQLTSGFSQKYEISGRQYELKVIRVFNSQGYETGAVVLEGEGKRQIMQTAGYESLLFWIGDLDRDNKPDLFLQVSESDYFADHILFLSSQAEKGKLVKKVACISFSDSC